MELPAQIGPWLLTEALDGQGPPRYLATGGSGGAPVEVMVLTGEDADPEVFDKIAAAVRLLQRHPHPGLPKVLSVHLDAAPAHVVFDHAPGPSLRAALRQGRLSPCQIVSVVREAAGALDHLQRCGSFYHPALGPRCLILAANGVRLQDLFVFFHTRPVMGMGRVRGDLSYLSPEQVRGVAMVPGSSVFALGVMLYEALVGVHPFRGDNDMETLMRIMRDEAPPPAAQAPHLDPALLSILSRCLHKDPADRYPDPAALALALSALPQGEPLPGGGVADVPAAARDPAGTVRRGAVSIEPCPLRWEDLDPIRLVDGDERRHCGRCDRDVVRARGEGHLAVLAAAGACASVEPERPLGWLGRLRRALTPGK